MGDGDVLLADRVAVVDRAHGHCLRRAPIAGVAVGEDEGILVARHSAIGVDRHGRAIARGDSDSHICPGVGGEHNGVLLTDAVGVAQFGERKRGDRYSDAVGLPLGDYGEEGRQQQRQATDQQAKRTPIPGAHSRSEAKAHQPSPSFPFPPTPTARPGGGGV